MRTRKGEIELRRVLRRMAKRETGPLDPHRTLSGTLAEELKYIGGRVETVRQYVLALLEARLENAFDLEELGDLCHGLGVKLENMAGATLIAKTASLVDWADRNGRIDDLVEVARELRPGRRWD